MLSSLDEVLQLKFGLGQWKKNYQMCKQCIATPVFCENPGVHPPKGWQTHLNSKRKRRSSEQSSSQPDPVLSWWWTSQGTFLPLWKARKAHFPHLYLGAALLLSRCQNRHINTAEYHREEQGSIGTLQLPDAKQHSIQATEKTSEGFIYSK